MAGELRLPNVVNQQLETRRTRRDVLRKGIGVMAQHAIKPPSPLKLLTSDRISPQFNVAEENDIDNAEPFSPMVVTEVGAVYGPPAPEISPIPDAIAYVQDLITMLEEGEENVHPEKIRDGIVGLVQHEGASERSFRVDSTDGPGYIMRKAYISATDGTRLIQLGYTYDSSDPANKNAQITFQPDTTTDQMITYSPGNALSLTGFVSPPSSPTKQGIIHELISVSILQPDARPWLQAALDYVTNQDPDYLTTLSERIDVNGIYTQATHLDQTIHIKTRSVLDKPPPNPQLGSISSQAVDHLEQVQRTEAGRSLAGNTATLFGIKSAGQAIFEASIPSMYEQLDSTFLSEAQPSLPEDEEPYEEFSSPIMLYDVIPQNEDIVLSNEDEGLGELTGQLLPINET